jgi:membrane protein CcdC involved in cytochrome C biogenesis
VYTSFSCFTAKFCIHLSSQCNLRAPCINLLYSIILISGRQSKLQRRSFYIVYSLTHPVLKNNLVFVREVKFQIISVKKQNDYAGCLCLSVLTCYHLIWWLNIQRNNMIIIQKAVFSRKLCSIVPNTLARLQNTCMCVYVCMYLCTYVCMCVDLLLAVTLTQPCLFPENESPLSERHRPLEVPRNRIFSATARNRTPVFQPVQKYRRSTWQQRKIHYHGL